MNTVRISCAAFASLKVDERIALLINKRSGESVLTPIGGALEVSEARVLRVLMNRLGLTFADFEKGPKNGQLELQFIAPEFAVETVCGLFAKLDNGPGREMREALVDETGVFTKEQFKSGRWKVKLRGYGRQRSGRSHRSPMLTVRLVSIYEVWSDSLQAREVLRSASEDPKSPLVLASPEEINQGEMVDGMKIASITQLLLNPKPKL